MQGFEDEFAEYIMRGSSDVARDPAAIVQQQRMRAYQEEGFEVSKRYGDSLNSVSNLPYSNSSEGQGQNLEGASHGIPIVQMV